MWLAVRRTPYHEFFFELLRKKLSARLDVYYTSCGNAERPWNSDTDGETDGRLPLSVLWRALSDRRTLVIVTGWNNGAKLLVMVVRAALRLPFAFWSDTLRVPVSLVSRVKLALLRPVLRRSVAVLSTGTVGVERVKELGLEPRSGIVMNFPFWVPLPAAVPRNKRPQEGIRFLAAGRLIERKGYAHLIKACGILRKHGFRSFKLEIAGVGPESERLSNLTEELGVSEHVEFLGWLQPNELAEARARNEVFVHVVPEEDPFPVAVLEAMAAGMVVLGSKRAGSVVDRVRDGIDGLVLEGGDPEEIARAMGRLMKGDSDVRRMGRSARKTAATWHPDRGVEKMSWLLDQVGTES